MNYVIISVRMVICRIVKITVIIDLTGKMRRLKKVKQKNILGLLLITAVAAFILSGCGSENKQPDMLQPPPANENLAPANVQSNNPALNQNPNVNSGNVPSSGGSVSIDVNDDVPSQMISYDVTTIGRSNPFMPYNEMIEYEKARQSAIAEANYKNAQIRKIKNLQDYRIREEDDISPYKFNLPVPPTSLDTHTVAAKITRTKVVGIMYNTKSPSAIINVDNKDYLVRPGDKIIGQEYKVVKITPSWVTAAMGSNVYSAAIGELFSKDGIETNQTDIYNLKERFGGRKI